MSPPSAATPWSRSPLSATAVAGQQQQQGNKKGPRDVTNVSWASDIYYYDDEGTTKDNKEPKNGPIQEPSAQWRQWCLKHWFCFFFFFSFLLHFFSYLLSWNYFFFFSFYTSFNYRRSFRLIWAHLGGFLFFFFSLCTIFFWFTNFFSFYTSVAHLGGFVFFFFFFLCSIFFLVLRFFSYLLTFFHFTLPLLIWAHLGPFGHFKKKYLTKKEMYWNSTKYRKEAPSSTKYRKVAPNVKVKLCFADAHGSREVTSPIYRTRSFIPG